MDDKSDKPLQIGSFQTGKVARIGAAVAIGSTALASAILYASRRKDRSRQLSDAPPHLEDVPATD